MRIERIDLDEAPSALLGPVPPDVVAAGPGGWRPGEPLRPAGAPWLAVLDLPGGSSAPRVAVAAEPWTPMEIHVGASGQSLSVRAKADRPATVGRLEAALPPGRAHRWDEAGTVLLRLEGRDPESLPAEAVLNGANRLAVETSAGWELLQFRMAEQTGADTWRLSGLLRGQAGTEAEARAGAAEGARAVVLDDALVQVGLAPAERGLPLAWRAAPAGAPAGGLASAEASFTWRGIADRPWGPAHFKASQQGGDRVFSWVRRARTGGDGWDLEPPLGEEWEAYRLEIVHGAAVVTAYETGGRAFVWTAAAQAAAFPDGLPEGLVARVAQGSAAWGWGATAEAALG